MKKFLVLMLVFLMTLGLASTALAGDLKIMGDVKSFSYFGDEYTHEADHEMRVRVRFHQDVNDMWSWRFRIRNTWGDFSDAKVQLDEAYVMYKFANNRVDFGRYNAVWDQDHSYFGTQWNGSAWQERNIFGVALNSKINDNFSIYGSVFSTDTNKTTPSETHYGIKGTYKNKGLTLSGALFSKAEDTNDLLVQAIYDVNKTFSLHGAAQVHCDDINANEYNALTLGASVKFDKFLVWVDHQFKDLENDNENNTLIGMRYEIFKKSYLYTEFYFPEADNKDKITVGFNLEF